MLSLKAMRKDMGLSQQEVARKVGITQPYYANIENEIKRPSVDTAKLIAAALGFDWTLFFSDEQDEKAV